MKTQPSRVAIVLFCLGMNSFAQTAIDSHVREDTQSSIVHSDQPEHPWTVAPSYSYSFFNKGRDDWQRETLDIYYQLNKDVLLGTSVDFMQRPPSGDDVMYSFNGSWYARNDLEIHGEVSVTPGANFLPDQIYSAGLKYTLNPKVTLLLDVDRLEFDTNSIRPDYEITQIKPGVTYWLTEKRSVTFRYTHGWLHDQADFDYYSASVRFYDMPHDGQLTIGVAYGTDPELDFGAMAATLSDAYIGSIYYKQPIKPDLSIYAGVEYVYRMRADNNGELYQSITPTIGLSWKF